MCANEKIEEARSLFLARNYDKALMLFELVIDSRDEDLSPYFGAAHIYEYGLSSEGVNLKRAFDYYSKVSEFDEDTKGAVNLALARTILISGDQTRAREAIEYCNKSLLIKRSSAAHIVLGVILENWEKDVTRARDNFIKAFRLGSPWGLKFYARSLMSSKRYVSGAVLYLFATLMGPVYFLRYGKQSAFG